MALSFSKFFCVYCVQVKDKQWQTKLPPRISKWWSFKKCVFLACCWIGKEAEWNRKQETLGQSYTVWKCCSGRWCIRFCSWHWENCFRKMSDFWILKPFKASEYFCDWTSGLFSAVHLFWTEFRLSISLVCNSILSVYGLKEITVMFYLLVGELVLACYSYFTWKVTNTWQSTSAYLLSWRKMPCEWR